MPAESESEYRADFLHQRAPTGEPPWELRLELVTRAREKWGYLNLMRMSGEQPLPLDVNVLTEEFRNSLSDAVDRDCTRLEAAAQTQDSSRGVLIRKLAAGSRAE